MNIDDVTIKEAKEIAELFSNNNNNRQGINDMIGARVIVRTISAGCWFGLLEKKSGDEVILKNARRMWRWWAAESISLSACAIYGIKRDDSRIVEPVDSVWLQAIEIIPCTEIAVKSFEDAPYVKAE